MTDDQIRQTLDIQRLHEEARQATNQKAPMSKATVSQQPQPVQVPKRPHLVALPSGRVLEFGNVIDCMDADTFRDYTGISVDANKYDLALVQQVPDGTRVVYLSRDDAQAALHVMRSLALVVLGQRPTAPKIEIAHAGMLGKGGA